MRRVMRVLLAGILGILLLCWPTVVLAMSNPANITFGTGASPVYNVFYNVLETGDWLIAAEGFVNYDLSTTLNVDPSGAGAETSISSVNGTATHWQAVIDDNDNTYVYTGSTAYLRDLYAITDTGITVGEITSVSLHFRISSNNTAVAAYALPEFYLNGNYYTGSAQTATNAFSTKNQIWYASPATGLAWTWAEVNGMQIGLSLAIGAAGSEARASEVYATVNYEAVNPGYDAEDAFTFDLLNTAGNVTLETTPLKAYGDRPISIYLSSARVSALGLTTGTGYGLRIMGNPMIFASGVGNNVTVFLNSADYIDQSLSTDSLNPLRNVMIQIAQNMENYDSPSSDYIITIQGTRYLTQVGGGLFLEGIPNLDTMCPILFQNALEVLSGNAPTAGVGTYSSNQSIANNWSGTISSGLTNLGVFMGLNQQLAGAGVLFVIGIALAIYAFARTGSGVVTTLLVVAMPIVGAYVGLMPMALAFALAIILMMLLGYFFFSRGAL